MNKGTKVESCGIEELFQMMFQTYIDNMVKGGKTEEEIDEVITDLVDDLVEIMRDK